MFSVNRRGGRVGRERCGERTRAPLGWQFWRRKALLLVLCAGESLPHSLAFGFFTLPRGVDVALSSRPRLPSRGGHKGEHGFTSVLGACFPLCTKKNGHSIRAIPLTAYAAAVQGWHVVLAAVAINSSTTPAVLCCST